MTFIKKINIGLIVPILFLVLNASAQTNTSQEGQYKTVNAPNPEYYKTTYDNGYVILRDGTRLEGQISLGGSSYDQVSLVRIRTNTGEKYNFQSRSLLEYGLSSAGGVNDTPGLFTWSEKQGLSSSDKEKTIESSIRFDRNPREGYAEFGYVNLKSGKKKEGEIWLNESKGKVKSIEIRDSDKKKETYDVDEVTSYGVQTYKDEKFDGAWSLVKWEISDVQSVFANNKSIMTKGYVEKTSGERVEGLIQLISKSTLINQVQVRSSEKAKPDKIDVDEIKAYGYTLTIDEYYQDISKVSGTAAENMVPYMRFYPGLISFTDGSYLEGLVARASTLIDGDMLFAENESAVIQSFESENVEEVIQDIPIEDQEAYDEYYYAITHVKGYLKDPDPYYVYEHKNPDMPTIFETKYQPGFVILTSGEEIVGSFKISSQGTIVKYLIQEGDAKPVKYAAKDVAEYGLVKHNAKTVFSRRSYGLVKDEKAKSGINIGGVIKIAESQPVKSADNSSTNVGSVRAGYLVLMESEELIEGELSITEDYKTDRLSDRGILVTTFSLTQNGNTTVYDEPKVKYYGIRDIPVDELTDGGASIKSDPRQNFHPGSFDLNGSTKTGYVAYAKQMIPGKDDAIFYAPTMDGNANLYYLDKGVSNVKQTIEETFEAYDPSDASFLLTKTTETNVVSNGYLIKADGSKVEGSIEMSFPPKLWFATKLILTKSDGTIEEYEADGSVVSVSLIADGKEQRFEYFDKTYVEVLDSEGDWVLFKNPHPTTPSFIGDLANMAAQGALAAGQEALDREVQKMAVKATVEGKDVLAESAASFLDREKIDWTAQDVFEMYANEHMLLNTKNKREVMYIPNSIYRRVEGELMGSMDYLLKESDEQRGLKRLKNPKTTMAYLQETFE